MNQIIEMKIMFRIDNILYSQVWENSNILLIKVKYFNNKIKSYNLNKIKNHNNKILFKIINKNIITIIKFY